jgi:hypothetical protein
MTLATSIGVPMEGDLLLKYFESLINKLFKILPIKEETPESLPIYIESLQLELLGCKSFIYTLQNDGNFLAIISILQYLAETPECSVRKVRREVFRLISICNKLSAIYAQGGDAK